ncbi:pyridoxamine 5'-phosphate oxidase family protein [Salinilacihabitans rarus]|uniref:pyridoxamine 5'-phosphate oxidase family protein n=1 Tax=Salinilacihabitans rarus TaxID=2961596 RepID=UPI0020C85545|nr:pyridoxamine 5'-phosphate oxidase family protein [Salinilacihabitans rarus]
MGTASSRAGKELSEDEVRAMLASNHHGVLSMGADDRGYGLPMTYGYDEADDRLVLGFVSAPDSKKRRFVAAAEEVTLTVYTYEDVDSWRSVVVTGTLESVSESEVSGHLAPLFFVEEDEATGERRFVEFGELEREWYEFRIDDLSGRHSGWPED